MAATIERELDDNLQFEEDAQKDKYLTFKLGSEEYGVEISYVTEIIGIQKITELPDMPEFIKGVINLRGKVLPVIDMRLRFEMDETVYSERTCFIVVDISDFMIGLIVDEVLEVLDIPPQNIDPAPKASSKVGRQYIKGIGKINDDIEIILDLEKIFSEEEFNDISKI